MFLGELSLDGSVRAVRGELSAAIAARENGIKAAVPESNAKEVAVVEGIEAYALKSLPQAVDLINSPESFERVRVDAQQMMLRVVDQWAYANGVALHFIDPGKPVQNALIESFNGKFRDECLNQNWHTSLEDARRVIEAWLVDYNMVHPHSSLGYQTPEEYKAGVARRPASPPTPVDSIRRAWEQTEVQEPRSVNL
jgi:hypothetical protein